MSHSDVDEIAAAIDRHMKPSDVADAWLMTLREGVNSGMISQEVADKLTVMAAALFMILSRESNPNSTRECAHELKDIEVPDPDGYREVLDKAIKHLQDHGVIVEDTEPDKGLH